MWNRACRVAAAALLFRAPLPSRAALLAAAPRSGVTVSRRNTTGDRRAPSLVTSSSTRLSPPAWTRPGEGLDVVGHDVLPADRGGPGPGGPEQPEGGAGRHAQVEIGAAAAGLGQVDDVALQAGGDVDGLGQVDHHLHVGVAGDRAQ